MGTELDGLNAVMPHSKQRELENYKLVFDQHAIISVTDALGRIIDSNELFSKISGFPREELIGRDHRMLNSDYHPKSFFEGMWRTIGAGKVWQSNIRNRRKHGELYWVATTIVPFQDEKGQPHKYFSICTDVTAQVKAEDELQCSLQLFHVLSETVAAGVMLHRGGKLIYANPVTERLTGFSHDELLNMDYWEIAHLDSRELALTRGQARLRGEAIDAHAELHINTKSATETWVESSATITGYQGEPTVLLTCVDITERKRAEAAQRHAQQILAQIVHLNPQPMFVIDADCVVTHWNQACEMITGISATEMVGTNNHWRAFYTKQRLVLADLVVNGASQADIDESHYSNLRRYFQLSDGVYNVEIFHPSLGVHGLWLSCTVAPLMSEKKQVVGAITTFRDITSQKLFEEKQHHVHRDLEQLVQSRTAELEQVNLRLEGDVQTRERAEAVLLRRNLELSELNARLNQAQEQLLQNEKMASIGQLAAGVAHEINNPIGYVHSNIGALETYLNDLFLILDAYASTEDGLTDRTANVELQRLKAELSLDFLRKDIPLLMAESKEGISRVSKIVQDLKDFSHVNSSQEWKWADLHQGLNSTLNVVNNEIKYKAEVIKEYGILPEIECLPSEINQVFLNLLVNAAHAIAEGQRGLITLRSGCDNQFVWVEVVDTGRGIAPENLKRIFDPFFTTKPIGKGTGLGLSLSYGIVTKHGGSIEVDSKVGIGTTFRVNLPQRQSQESIQEDVL
jgi:two-component system NtrC family sensor kinase